VGSEAVCSVRYAGQVSEGKALLETTELLFRGAEFRLRIPFRDIASLADSDSQLCVSFDGKTAVFQLGKDAANWAEKIRNPRGLLDKLGVKAGASVAVLGVEDGEFIEQLRSRTSAVESGATPPELDFVFYEADRLEDLARLPGLVPSLKRNGAVWVVSPKGKGALVKDTDVMAAAREAGLVDTKVVSFSDTHTALKLVIPLARR
jgi:hypothetical protein